jgi:DNA end-binding protein Ku
MARPLWKGSISFGLVNIPIELHTAVRSHRPQFKLLHATDKAPVRFERICMRDGQPLAWDDLVKGYEYARGRFVVLTKEDFRAAALEKTRTIDILDFVKADEIDDRYFETPYYATPSKGSERAYVLLREAIRSSGRIGISSFILRNVQHLAAIEVIDQALVLTVMRFADELFDVGRLDLPGPAKLRKPELDLAVSLVNSLAAEWDPARYTDRYRENLMRIIQSKQKGKSIELEPMAEPRQPEVVDLMERLRRSLAQRGPARRPRKTGMRKRARRAA